MNDMSSSTTRMPAALLRDLGLVEEPGGSWRIPIPDRFNMAEALVSAHARGPLRDRVAVTFEAAGGACRPYTFGELETASDALAATLGARGIAKGDVVAIHTGSRPETIIGHLAAYKLGAIVATISQLYGPDTLKHILADSGARVIVTQDEVWARMRPIRHEFPELECCIVVGECAADELRFEDCCRSTGIGFRRADTRSSDPALLIYTSGSTGMPKGILHAHRLLPAYRPTLELFYNLDLRERDLVFWTPADWAWIGGFVDVVYPALLFGHRVVASQERFEPERALDLMSRHGVTHSLMTPTALRRMAQIAEPRRGRDLRLRTVFTGGEALSRETYNWLCQELGIVCNEGYGMSEVNHAIGNCERVAPIRPGSMGWEFPGHRVALVDDNGNAVGPGEVGEIVVDARDPTLFLGYWRSPDLTASLRLGPWIRTYDLGTRDADGYFWYEGRKDDLIKSAGYRIGPFEVEDALRQHPAVGEAAVIGSPDPDRGHVVKAFIKLAPGWEPGEPLVKQLQQHVRDRLAAYKYPRIIEFVDAMPLTSTGKISRSALRKRDAESRRVTAAGR